MCCCTAGGVDHPAHQSHLRRSLDGYLLAGQIMGLLPVQLPTMQPRSLVTICYVSFGKLKNAQELPQATHERIVQSFVTLLRTTREAKMADLSYPCLGTHRQSNLANQDPLRYGDSCHSRDPCIPRVSLLNLLR